LLVIAARLGWIEGRNLRIDLRVTTGDMGRMQAHAAEAVRLAPDVIVTSTSTATRVVQQTDADHPDRLRGSISRAARISVC
jgi:ABC-type uncharacterized transport system substrate-binding protein